MKFSMTLANKFSCVDTVRWLVQDPLLSFYGDDLQLQNFYVGNT